MVGLQGLSLNDAFWHLNVSASKGLKSFCPWWFKFGGNTETIANSSQGGGLQASNSKHCLSIIYQHVSAGGPGTLIKVQDEVT